MAGPEGNYLLHRLFWSRIAATTLAATATVAAGTHTAAPMGSVKSPGWATSRPAAGQVPRAASRLTASALGSAVASAQGVVELWWGAEFIAQARRNGAVDVGDAEPSSQLRTDYRATGVAHHVVLRVEGGDHAAGELWESTPRSTVGP
jgi:hypothetical protein